MLPFSLMIIVDDDEADNPDVVTLAKEATDAISSLPKALLSIGHTKVVFVGSTAPNNINKKNRS